jgi:hypothetical protein
MDVLCERSAEGKTGAAIIAGANLSIHVIQPVWCQVELFQLGNVVILQKHRELSEGVLLRPNPFL